MPKYKKGNTSATPVGIPNVTGVTFIRKTTLST